MLTLFPGEKPTYVSEGNLTKFCAKSTFTANDTHLTCVTLITRNDKSARGEASVEKDGLAEPQITRCNQRLVRLAFYRAAVPAFCPAPPWGALTGIRPGKTVTDMLLGGKSGREAVSQMVNEYYVSPPRAEMSLKTARASIQVQSTLESGDICLYVGIPFCPTRCTYCSFISNSVEKSRKLVEPYLDALYREIADTANTINKLGLRVISIYIGGGTPTTLTAPQLDALTLCLERCFDLGQLKEYTVEAGRPDTITAEKLDVLSQRGVSRISINPQTMQADVLKAIGRDHTPADIISAMELASNYSFWLNMDLIAGLPADTPEGFRDTLDTVMSYNPENITVHTLALKKGAKIMLEGTVIPDAKAVGSMVDYAQQALTSGDYRPYYLYRQKYISGGFENVGFSLESTDSLYNICIMEQLCSVIALGAGGSTKLINPATGKINRIFNPKYPYEYINRDISALRDGISGFYQNEVFTCSTN